MLVTMLMSSGTQLVAAETIVTPYHTNANTVWTSGGANGKVKVTFRVSCYQNSSDNTKYSWSSSMTPQQGVTMTYCRQQGEITYTDYTRQPFNSSKATYNYTIKKI